MNRLYNVKNKNKLKEEEKENEKKEEEKVKEENKIEENWISKIIFWNSQISLILQNMME